MRAHEERIVEKNLSPWRLVVGVVQTHQRVSEERHDQPARIHQILFGAGGLDDFRQIGSRLQGTVPRVIESGGPFAALAAGKHRTRHLEFPKLPGQRNQAVTHILALRQFVQAFSQGEQRVERDQALPIHHGVHPVGQFLPNSLAVGMRLIGSG